MKRKTIYVVGGLVLLMLGTWALINRFIDREDAVVVQILPYAISDFEILLDSNSQELQNVTIERIEGLDLWRVAGNSGDPSNRQVDQNSAVEFLIAWGKQQAEKEIKKMHRGELISYVSACIVHSRPQPSKK